MGLCALGLLGLRSRDALLGQHGADDDYVAERQAVNLQGVTSRRPDPDAAGRFTPALPAVDRRSRWHDQRGDRRPLTQADRAGASKALGADDKRALAALFLSPARKAPGIPL